jgi:hypothetical protein
MLTRYGLKAMWFSVLVGAFTLVPVVCYAETITNVTIYDGDKAIATAPSGVIAAPPEVLLTITGTSWNGGLSEVLKKYLQKTVSVRATRNGAPYNANLRITGIGGNGVTKLAPP